jgi:four helix bundle protein
MKTENALESKSFAFAIRIVNLCKYLRSNKKEYIVSEQVLRAGTSIGANVAEAICAMSKNDFLAKLYIAYKECSETQYWLKLLNASEYITDKEFNSLFADCNEIIKILSATTKTIQTKVGKK